MRRERVEHAGVTASRQRAPAHATAAGLVAALLVASCSASSSGTSGGTPASTPATSARATTSPAPTPASSAPRVQTRAMPVAFVVAAASDAAGLTRREATALLTADAAGTVAGPTVGAGPSVRTLPSDEAVIEEVVAGRARLGIVAASAVDPRVCALLVDDVDPLRAPAAYPLKTIGDPSGPVTTMTITGDIMMARRVGDAIRRSGDDAWAFRHVAEQLAAADLTIGNLESTLARLGPPTQGDAFAADPRARAGLRLAGFDVLSLANNHTGDFGAASLLATIALLHDAGFATVGAGIDRRAARAPALLERNGIRFGFLAFNAIGETPAPTASRPGAVQVRMQPRTGPLNQRDLDVLVAAVRALRARADVVTVLPHWGAQYTHTRHRDQRRVARALAAAGADLVVGTHPHWVQGVELLGETMTFYSTGNFVFDMDLSRQTREGIAVEAVFWGSELKAATPAPVTIGDDHRPHFGGSAVLQDLWRASTPPFNSL